MERIPIRADARREECPPRHGRDPDPDWRISDRMGPACRGRRRRRHAGNHPFPSRAAPPHRRDDARCGEGLNPSERGQIMNPVGLISMQYARPFTAEHFPLFDEMRGLGYDFVELLVPEPGELDLNKARAALDTAELGVVLAARVNLQRNLSSDDPAAHRAGIDYLKYAA